MTRFDILVDFHGMIKEYSSLTFMTLIRRPPLGDGPLIIAGVKSWPSMCLWLIHAIAVPWTNLDFVILISIWNFYSN